MSLKATSLVGVSLPPLASAYSETIGAEGEARIRSIMHTSVEGLSPADLRCAISFLQRDIVALREELAAMQTKIAYVENESAKAFMKAAALIDELRLRLTASLQANKLLRKEVYLRKDLATLALWELARFSGVKIVELSGSAGPGGVHRIVFLDARYWYRAISLIHASSGTDTHTSSKCKLE